MEILHIHHNKFEAKISLKGAQILSFIPKGKSDIFWCCDEEFWSDVKPIRGGVPICWPWFGVKNGVSHGFARDLNWTLNSQIEDTNGIKLEFVLSQCEFSRALWDFDFEAKITFVLNDNCEIWFETNSKEATQIALHSYFRVDDVRDIEIRGLGDMYIDKLQNNTICQTKNTKKTLTNANDSIYTYPEKETEIINRKTSQKLTITHVGHNDVVLWNPWEDGEKNLKELKSGDFKNFVCVETACVGRDFFGKIGVKISQNTISNEVK